MKQSIIIASLAVAAMLAGCANSASDPPTSSSSRLAPPTQTEDLRIAQFDLGGKRVFRQCRADECPRPTPKTLALATPSLPTLDKTTRSNGLDLPSNHTKDFVAAASEAVDEDETAFSHTVLFGFDRTDMGSDEAARLEAWLGEQGPLTEVLVVGHTDAAGSAQVNQQISAARAAAVKALIEARRPELSGQIHAEAAGSCCFAESNQSAQGRAANRRVEVTATSTFKTP